MKLTLSVRSFQVPATPLTTAWPPSSPSVPTSRATRVTSEAKLESWSTIVLMVVFSSEISPLTSTVIFLLRSPSATAVVTSAMLRTCAVRLLAIELTESVRSFQVPETPATSAWPPSLPSVPTSRATRVTSEANERSWSTIVFIVSLRARISPFTSTVIFLERSPLATAVVTSAMLRTWPVRLLAIEFTLSVRSFQVPATPSHVGLAAQLALGAHLARHARDLRGEARELVHHRVDGVLQGQDLALDVHGDLLGEVAGGDRGRDLRDVAHLAGQVAGHQVDVVREVLPGAGHALDVGLAAELAFRAHLARHARDLGGERAELVHHRVDGVLQLQDLALDVHGDLLGEVAVGHRGGHGGDVAHLAGQVAGHQVHVVGEVLPGAGHALDLGLAAELALGAHLAGHARDLGGEARELVHHRVDGLGRAQELALHGAPVHLERHRLREVALGHRADHARGLGHRVHQVADELVDAADHRAPGAAHVAEVAPLVELAFLAHRARRAAPARAPCAGSSPPRR